MELFMNPANRFVAGFIGSPPMNQLQATIVEGTDGPAAQLSGSIQIPLPSAEGLNSAAGQAVVVGIRPEDVLLQSSSNQNAVSLAVDLIEPLGSEALIHAHVGDAPFVIKTDTYGDISHLSGIDQFYVNVERVKVFDQASGDALYQPGRA
jgi:multiple sugar transport system ATP-binding protein